MLNQIYDFALNYTPLLTFGVLIVFLILGLYCFFRVRRYLISLVIFLFSMIIGFYSFNESDLPFSPYFQIFFIVIQFIIFVNFTIEVYYKNDTD